MIKMDLIRHTHTHKLDMVLYLFVVIIKVEAGCLPDDIIHSTTSIHIIQSLPHPPPPPCLPAFSSLLSRFVHTDSWSWLKSVHIIFPANPPLPWSDIKKKRKIYSSTGGISLSFSYMLWHCYSFPSLNLLTTPLSPIGFPRRSASPTGL